MVPAIQFQEAVQCYASRKCKCLISSYSRLNDLYSLCPPSVLGLYFYYGNVSHFALFSDVHICLPLLTIGHTVGRDYMVLSLHDPMYIMKPLSCLAFVGRLKAYLKSLPCNDGKESLESCVGREYGIAIKTVVQESRFESTLFQFYTILDQ